MSELPWTGPGDGSRGSRPRNQHGLLSQLSQREKSAHRLFHLPLLTKREDQMPELVSRRSFIKLIAATGAGVTIPGCQPEVRKLIPYVIPDENVIPGVPSFYATRCGECPAGCGIVARVREGRVIKLEGNPVDPISQGGLCARGQAALQGLYNPDRLNRPKRRGPEGRLQEVGWDSALREIVTNLQKAAKKGRDRVAFIGANPGPTLSRIADQWLKSWTSSRRLNYEPLSGD